MQWLLKVEEEILIGKRTTHNATDEFTKHLCILLSGIRAATSRHIVSSTMAHLLVSFNGTRFTFSHDFGYLLVTQLEATLEGLLINILFGTTKVVGETYLWPDSNSKDYIQHPLLLAGCSSYELAMNFKKEH